MASLVTSFVQPHDSPRNDSPQWPSNLHVGLSKVGESVILRPPGYCREYSGRRIHVHVKRSLREYLDPKMGCWPKKRAQQATFEYERPPPTVFILYCARPTIVGFGHGF